MLFGWLKKRKLAEEAKKQEEQRLQEEAIQIAITDHNENYEQASKHINDDSLSEYMFNYYNKILVIC